MPFIKYGNIQHRCQLPNYRDGGNPLQRGDQWQCDYVFPEPDADVVKALAGQPVRKPDVCGKIWERVSSNDQRDPGDYWKQINPGGPSLGQMSNPR